MAKDMGLLCTGPVNAPKLAKVAKVAKVPKFKRRLITNA